MSPPSTPGLSLPSPATPRPPARVSSIPTQSSISDDSETSQEHNKENNFTNDISNENKSKENLTTDGIIVTEKVNNNILDEMPDTKMVDLSQSRQYNSYESIGDESLISCGSMRVESLAQPSGGLERQDESASRSMSPTQFAEPSPVRPKISNESPSCSRRSLSMEVDDASERNSQSDQQTEPMEVSILLVNNHNSALIPFETSTVKLEVLDLKVFNGIHTINNLIKK